MVLIVVGFFIATLPYVWGRVKREASYRSILHSYSAVFRPGMSRQEVEGYLQAEGVSYSQSCCINERSAFADVARIGEEKVFFPFCSSEQVLVAFEFAARERHRWPVSYPSDELKRIVLWRPADCL
jgi:hypothetical protein